MADVEALLDGLPEYVRSPPVECVVFGFGTATDGQLGLDTDQNVLNPKVIEALLGTRFRGRAYGRSPVVAGSRNTLAIDADGQVLAWGWNARATLGNYRRANERKPRRVAGLQGVAVEQVAIGGWHCLAVDAEGNAWSWGGNEYQQCGSPTEERDIVQPTPCLPGLRVRQVSAGGMHSLALTEDGEVWMWGEPWGDFSMTINRSPRRIDATGGFVRIACGAFHNLALDDQGQCFSWGINDYGQLGNGTTSYCTEPMLVEGLEGIAVSDISAGGWHSLAITDDGEVWVWGRGEYGRLGLGDKSGSSKLRPHKVKALEGHRVVEASCGGTHTAVVTDDGRCFIFGRGSFGRLGTGRERDHLSPVELQLPGGPERWRVITAAAGGRHTLVLALPDNGDLLARQQSWREASVKAVSFSPAASGGVAGMAARRMPHDDSWVAGEADDEGGPGESPTDGEGASVDGASVDGASVDGGHQPDYLSPIPGELSGGSAPMPMPHRMGVEPRHSGNYGFEEIMRRSPSASHVAAAMAAHGLRDDTQGDDRP